MLSEFESRYPKHYHELKVQMNREHKQIPVLLKATGGGDGTC